MDRPGITARFRLDWPGFSLDVDLQLPGRGVSALFGPSGSGKTTVLRCLAGLERAQPGSLSVDGVVWQGSGHWVPTHQRPIGYVFQEASLFTHLSVMGNLRYGMRRAKQPRQSDLEQAIDLFGIEQLLERRPDRLSGGERQRVAMARALAVGPRLLLMDEPLAALDAQRKSEILPYLERLHDALAIPVVYVSHATDEVARLADHLVVMDAGRVRASGPLADALSRLDLPLGLDDDMGAVLEARVAEIDTEWHLTRLEFAGGSLWARDTGLAPGRRIRLRVLARDVSLSTERPGASSIQNTLRGRVDAVGDDRHPGLMLVRLRVGDVWLLSRITRRAAKALGVVVGVELWVQVKSVALAP